MAGWIAMPMMGFLASTLGVALANNLAIYSILSGMIGSFTFATLTPLPYLGYKNIDFEYKNFCVLKGDQAIEDFLNTKYRKTHFLTKAD